MANITEPIVLNKTMEVGLKNMCNKLESVAVAIGKSTILTTWEQIQNVVQAGMGEQSYPVGTQLTAHHDVYGDIVWDVVAHNYNGDSNGDAVPSMTLLAHDRLTQQQYDNSEGFYYAENGLSAGTYNITITTQGNWTAGTYQFTLTKDIPAGGLIYVGASNGSQRSWDNGAFTTCYACSLSSRSSTTLLESAIFTSGNSGTSLGTTGVELNHIQRLGYGNNNWGQSAFRQFLNSDKAKGSVWTPQTKFDRCPSWMTSLDGFIKGLDKDFLKVVGETKIGNRTNNVYESDGYTKSTKYFTVDKFWLASQREIFGTTEGTDDGTTQFPYFVGSTDADRVKTLIGTSTAGYWWLRSPTVNVASITRIVSTSGSLNSGGACGSYGAVPACVIY